MKDRYPRRGDRWDDRDRLGDFYDRDRGLSPEAGPFRPDEEYFGQHEQYGRGTTSGNPPDYRATSWRTSRRYGTDRGRERSMRYDRPQYSGRRDYGYSDRPDAWVGRSNFETGFAGWGSNRYDRNSYDPYWTSDQENEYRGGRDRHWWNRAADEVASWFGDEEAERRRQMDARRPGNFRGLGPKGYTRTDDRIKEDVNDRLTDDYALDASDVDVQVDDGDIVLSGTVESRYEKRRAEDLAESVSGVGNVENRIRVKDYDRSSWSSTSDEYTNDRTDTGYLHSGPEDRSRGVGGTT
jgi:osmotically-inducible protein OsmY